MMKATHTSQAVQHVLHAICERIDAMYDPARCKDREALLGLLNEERVNLMKLQSFAHDTLRDACYDSFRKDGVSYPEIFWVRHVNTSIDIPYFDSIRSEAIRIVHPSRTPSAPASGQDDTLASPGKIVSAATIVVGCGAVVIAATATPITKWLLALGIVAAAGGVLTLIWQIHGDQVSTTSMPARAPVQDETHIEESIAQLFNMQRRRCKESIQAWCDHALSVMSAALETAGDESTEANKP